MRTICHKCKRVVSVIVWSEFGADYICDKCGYISKKNTDRVKEVSKNESKGLHKKHSNIDK